MSHHEEIPITERQLMPETDYDILDTTFLMLVDNSLRNNKTLSIGDIKHLTRKAYQIASTYEQTLEELVSTPEKEAPA